MAAGYNIIHLAGPKFFDSNAPQFIKERHHNLGYLALPYANQMVSLYQKASRSCADQAQPHWQSWIILVCLQF